MALQRDPVPINQSFLILSSSNKITNLLSVTVHLLILDIFYKYIQTIKNKNPTPFPVKKLRESRESP